jgi:predicted peptidase
MAKQLEQHYLSESGDLDYLLFIPRDYQEGSTILWPLILFLHGRGESGDNLNIVKHHGIPRGYCKSLLSKMKIQARLKNPW